MKRLTIAVIPFLLVSAVNLTAADTPRSGGGPPPPVRVDTNNHTLEGFLAEIVREFEGGEGRWSFNLYDCEMVLVSDEGHDRVRLIAAIAPADKLDSRALRILLEANFDRALDAKYSIWKGTVWATYSHPLSALTRIELQSATRQVANLFRNYGTSFSSMDQGFSPGR